MGKKTPYIGQTLKWLGGLVAAWLLLLLPNRSATVNPVIERLTTIYYVSSHEETDESDYSSTDFIHVPAVLTNPLPGFSVVSSTECLPCIQWHFPQLLRSDVSNSLTKSGWAFGFLRFIFAHQMPINAP